MPRNFFRRIEVAFPVEDSSEERKILDTVNAFIEDNEFATELKSTGKYTHSSRRRKPFSAQEHLISETREAINDQLNATLRSASRKSNHQGEGDQEDA